MTNFYTSTRVLWFITILSIIIKLFIPALPTFADELDEGSIEVLHHAITLYKDLPLYGPNFQHFSFVNPDAPKGGTVVLSASGTFDTLNPYVIQGTPAAGLSLLYTRLAENSPDEAGVSYAALAESIDVESENRSVTFRLQPQACWHDNVPITADDVVWSFQTLVNHGSPFYRAYYAEVAGVDILSIRTVRFRFARPGNTELSLIVGELPVLPRHYWEGRSFNSTTLDPPIGSGSYRIESLDPGRSITYQLVQDWWGRNLPVYRGRFNFDRIRFEYYRDSTVMFEAFLGHQFDFRLENVARNWATGYGVSPVIEHQILREELPDNSPAGIQGFVFNTRRFLFSDPRVRKAISYLFDFEWINANLFYNFYIRSNSYFSNSDLASSGLPTTEELALLEPLRSQIPDDVFVRAYQAPVTDGSGNIRINLRAAFALLRDSGWELYQGRLVNAAGEPFRFEILIESDTMDRVVQPFIRNLQRVGIVPTVQLVDAPQYINRVENFDFDMIVGTFPESPSPGNEQRGFWGSTAKSPGSHNLAGINSTAVDNLINLVVTAPNRRTLITRVHALDRVLLWGYYIIPHWHTNRYRIAYWNRFAHPNRQPRYTLGFPDTWWVDPTLDEQLAASRGDPSRD
jgi:microcin C transport system substrate-binding protein